MGEAHHHHRRHQQAAGTTSSSRMAMRGEIVEVQGGHIVRSTGRKDRHSKVCTAKGPRDRRVRLSAHTAIQFYDVQDRLGYDRPSKAVDWLIKKAKAAIDELVQLPAWDPDTLNPNAPHQQQEQNQQMNDENSNHNDKESDSLIGAHRPLIDAVAFGTSGSGRIMEQLGENSNGSGSGFFPASLDTNIADTIKCFFPMGATAPETNNSSIQFQNYPQDLLSRTSSSSHNQDLRLSLQSLEDPILLHQAQTHHNQHQHNHHHQHNEHLFSETTSLGFDGASYVEEHSQFNRMVAWPADAADTGNGDHDGGGGGGRGFIFNSPSPMMTPLPPLFGHSQYLSQRGPLQSSNSPSVRAWMDPSIAATTDHYHHYLPPTFLHQSAISGDTRFASSGLSGFCIPARIQGEEEHDGVSDKPSSTSSDCRH